MPATREGYAAGRATFYQIGDCRSPKIIAYPLFWRDTRRSLFKVVYPADIRNREKPLSDAETDVWLGEDAYCVL